MQDLTTLVCAPMTALFIAASNWAFCSGVILLVSMAGICPPTWVVEVSSHNPIWTLRAGFCARTAAPTETNNSTADTTREVEFIQVPPASGLSHVARLGTARPQLVRTD